MPFWKSTQRKNRAERRTDRRFCNPKGIVSSSPGLRGTSYPGLLAAEFSTPTGLCHGSTAGSQPRWGWWPLRIIPKVARSSQPWALSRNPFGIHFRKALRACLKNPFQASSSSSSSVFSRSFEDEDEDEKEDEGYTGIFKHALSIVTHAEVIVVGADRALAESRGIKADNLLVGFARLRLHDASQQTVQ